MRVRPDLNPNEPLFKYAKFVNEENPILASKQGKIAGIVVKDPLGWILLAGAQGKGATDHYITLSECISAGEDAGYKFYQDE